MTDHKTSASFKQMDKDFKSFDKAMGYLIKREAQEAERRRRTADLQTIAHTLDKKHASPRSRRIVLTGLNEYYRVVNTYTRPEPVSTLEQVTPGLVLSAVVEQPIAASVTSGRPLPGGVPGARGTVILVSGQDHLGYTIKSRFLAAGGDPARVLLLHTVEQVDSDHVTIEDRPFSLARDLRFLEEAVTRTHAALVILDSLDACRPTELRQTLSALAQLAGRTGCAILLIRPLAPGQATVAQKPGSLELLAAVRSRLLILSDPEDQQRQRLLLATKHALCEQPPILGFQLTPSQQGVLMLDWLGSYVHPLPPYEKSQIPLSNKNLSRLRQAIRDTLHDCAAPMNARSLAAITGFSYDHVRKTLQRMLHGGQLASPARGLYTTPAHPCLDRPAASTGTPPEEPPVPTVAPVPGEPPLAAAQGTPPETPVPGVAPVPTVTAAPQSPDPENTPPAGPSKPPAPQDEGAQRSTPTETPDPPFPETDTAGESLRQGERSDAESVGPRFIVGPDLSRPGGGVGDPPLHSPAVSKPQMIRPTTPQNQPPPS